MLTAPLLLPADLTLQDGHACSEHPPPCGDPDGRPWRAVRGEEDGEGRPSVSALLCEEPW